MTRYIPLRERTRPYRITRGLAMDDWIVWDRRHCIGIDLPGEIIIWDCPTHAAAAAAALDAHLREQALKEPTA